MDVAKKYICWFVICFIFSCKSEVEKRNFFLNMPAKYNFTDEGLDNSIKDRFNIQNGLANYSKEINGKQYYRLFENDEDKVEGIAGYIRKEGRKVYLLPFHCGLAQAEEQEIIDFNSKIGDTISFIHECNPINKLNFILKNIYSIPNDSIYFYEVYPNISCDDCTRLKYFGIGLKSGFTKFHFENMSGTYDLTLSPSQSILKKSRM